MKKIKQFFKEWWRALGENIADEEDHYPYKHPPQERDINTYCPFCGYRGSGDELRCHLLNFHQFNN